MGVNNMFCQLISKKIAYINELFKLLQKYNTFKLATFTHFFKGNLPLILSNSLYKFLFSIKGCLP